MLTAYIRAAMHHARYELLADNEGFYGEVEKLPGVWAQAPTLELCREGLQSVLEGWLLLGLRLGHQLPVIDAIDLNVQQEVA